MDFQNTPEEFIDFSLLAISPLDGRYRKQCSDFQRYFSEYALITYRVYVELEWFQLLCETNEVHDCYPLDDEALAYIQKLKKVSLEDAKRVKAFEATTNHDVKAIEYYLKERFEESAIPVLLHNIEFIHFGCTSEDINNLSYSLMLKDCTSKLLIPKIQHLKSILVSLILENANVPLLSRTHGQPASPTTFGKELANFLQRIRHKYSHDIKNFVFYGKLNGAVGNYNSHTVAYPEVSWIEISRALIEDRLGLQQQLFSTQIECHDFIAEFCDAVARFNSVILDLDVDMWTYISRDLLKLKAIANEVGSSTMPHKINPIDFENSEGNIHLANAVLRCFSSKLPVSRLQRDLSDSTILRNLGIGFAYSYLSYCSTIRGLEKIQVDKVNMSNELNNNWAVIAEPIQMVMRKVGITSPYEKLKSFTRGKTIDESSIKQFIVKECASLSEVDRLKLDSLNPHSYTGLAEYLALLVASNQN